MRGAAAVLADLRRLGVTVGARGDGLVLRPASALPPEVLAEVRANKPALLALLGANDAPMPDDACDSEHLRAEPEMPAPGSPERERVDAEQRDMVAGLLAAAARRPG